MSDQPIKDDSISRDTVAKVASLARIRLQDNEAELYAPQLSKIIGFVEQLDDVDTENVKPLASVVDLSLELRPDEVKDGNYREDILANAPETAEGFFVVSKIVE